MLSMTLWLLTVLVPLQFLLGDAHGLNTLEYQPAKLAAIEAHLGDAWPRSAQSVRHPRREGRDGPRRHRDPGPRQPHSDPRPQRSGARPQGLPRRPAPVADHRPLLRLPDHGGNWRHHAGDGRDEPVAALAGRLFHADWFLRCCTLASPLGFIAVMAGWATTEVGRQPWTVYGLLRTSDFVSPSLTGLDVAISLVGYSVVYLVMFSAGFALMRATRATRPRRGCGRTRADRERTPGAAGPGAPSDRTGGRLMTRSFSISCRSGRSSSASASFSMCCWTASIWASASSMASRPIGIRAT